MGNPAEGFVCQLEARNNMTIGPDTSIFYLSSNPEGRLIDGVGSC